MRKYKIIPKLLVCTMLTTSSLFGFGMGDVKNATEIANNFSGGSDIGSNLLKALNTIEDNQYFTCSYSESDYPSLDDICESTYGKLEGSVSGKFDGIFGAIDDFLSQGVAGCSLKASANLGCSNRKAVSLCQRLREATDKFSVTPNNDANISNENLIYTGGDTYFKNNINACGDNSSDSANDDKYSNVKYGNTTAKELHNEVLSPDKVLSNSNSGGIKSLYNPSILDLYTSCVKSKLLSGANEGSVQEMCNKNNFSLPENQMETLKSIAEASNVFLADPLANSTAENYQAKSIVQKNMSNCDTSDLNFDLAGCQEEAFKYSQVSDTSSSGTEGSGVDISTAHKNKIGEVEKHTSILGTQIESATLPSFRIAFPNQKGLEKVVEGKKLEYIALSKKQMAQDVLFKNSLTQLSQLKKELLDINFRKIRVASVPFYEKRAIAKAKLMMEAGF